MELETKQFYERAIEQSTDAGIRQLLGDLAEEERKHASLAEHMESQQQGLGRQRGRRGHPPADFIRTPGRPAGPGRPDGWFRLHPRPPLRRRLRHPHQPRRLSGRPGGRRRGRHFSMGFAEALSDDGSLTGRGRPLLRGIVCGLMTALGGLGHAIPYLIPHFWTATAVAAVVVAIELGVISWIRNHYMDTPLLGAIFQVVVGGVLVFLAGILIGSS